MIKYSHRGIVTYVRVFNFPDGATGVDINIGSAYPCYHTEHVRVSAALQSDSDIMALLQTVNALRSHFPHAALSLSLPYVPYARQDRACNAGEAHSMQVMSDLINMCGFARVEVLDAHSDVAPALIRNCVNLPQSTIFQKIFDTFEDYYIVAPDAGAYKKAHNLAKSLSAKGVICANKVRDLATGKILKTSVNENVEGLKLLVADDICDGGATFIGLADVLRSQKCDTLELVVTHGLFTKGVGVLTDHYDKIYTTNSYLVEPYLHPKVQWINVV